MSNKIGVRYGLLLRWEKLKLNVSETWLRLRGVKGDMPNV